MRNPRTRIGVLATIATAAAIGLSGCASGGAADVATGTGTKVLNSTITYVHEQEPPCIWGAWVQEAYLSRQVFDSLVAWDDSGKAVPWLATKWTTSADRKDVTFTLKQGVKFTDGTTFDAAAVVSNVDNWVKNLGWNSFSYLTGATANADGTVTLHLSQPNPEFLRELSNGHYGIQSPTALAGNSAAQNCQYPVGTGAWKVKKWTKGQDILFERNGSYDSAPSNAENQGPAYEKYLDWKFADDATTRWSALTTGEADAIYDPPSSQWATAKKNYSVYSFITGGRQQAFSFNVAQGPFTDVRVRQAFVDAIDRKQIVESVFKGTAAFDGNGSLSPTNPFYLNVNDTYSYDASKANTLLDAAGWKKGKDGVREKDGEQLEVKLPYGAGAIVSQDGQTALQAVQQQVAKVGFKLDLIPLTQTQLFSGQDQAADEEDIEFGYWVWPAPNILDIVYNAGTTDAPNGNNTTHFDDAAVQAKITAAQDEPDATKRKADYEALQQYVNDEAIAVGFYDFTNNVVASKNLRGFHQDQGSNGLPIFSDAYLVK